MPNLGPYIVIAIISVLTMLISTLISRKKPWLIFILPAFWLILSGVLFISADMISSGWDGLIYIVLGVGLLASGLLSLIYSITLFFIRRKKSLHR
jgi:hypothetical protein